MSLELLGAKENVAFDLGQIQADFNRLKPVTLADALTLVHSGQRVIEKAQDQANDHGIYGGPSLPGGGKRDEVAGHLNWHAETLANLALDVALHPTKEYAPGDDLKKWVAQSYIEANAVNVGVSYLSAEWAQMWGEIGTKLAALPGQVLAAAGDALARGARQAVGALPRWFKVGAGFLVLGTIGFAGWRIVR